MKLNGTFVIRKIAGEIVIVPVGETALKFNGMITTTATGEYIWKMLEDEVSETEIVKAVTGRFEVDEETASRDVHIFLEQLQDKGFLD